MALSDYRAQQTRKRGSVKPTFVWEQSLGFTAHFVHLATSRFNSRFNFCARGCTFQTFVNEVCQINLCKVKASLMDFMCTVISEDRVVITVFSMSFSTAPLESSERL